MKLLSRFLLLCLCLEMVISPIKPGLGIITSPAALAQSCPGGQEWSETANRCLTKAAVSQASREVDACSKLSGKEQQQCFENNAKNASGNQTVANVEDLYSVTDQMKGINVAKTAAYALPLILFTYYLVKSKEKNKGKRCMAPSFLAMAAGALASAGGEVYGWIKHSSNLNKLNDKRKELSKENTTVSNKDQQKVDATNLQSEAFQLLADEQKSVADLAKVKKIFYGAATVAYAASAGIAVYELIQLNKAKALAPTSAAAAAHHAALVQKYQCVITDTEKEEMNNNFNKGIEADELKDKKTTSLYPAHLEIDLKDLGIDFSKFKLLAIQSHHIKNASSLEEIFLLTEEFESIKRGDYQSNYQEFKTTTKFVTNEEKEFLRIYAALTLDSSYDYFLTNEEQVPESNVVARIISKLTIEDSIAQNYKLGKNGQYFNVKTGKAADVMVDPKTGMARAPENLREVTVVAPKSGNRQRGETISNTPKQLVKKENALIATTIDIPKALQQSLSIKKTDHTEGAAITKSKTEAFLRSPKFRIAFGGVLGGLTAYMTADMAKQQKLAEQRQQKLLDLKTDFEMSQGIKICTPEERNDQRQPGCYCYTSEGSRNSSRTQSQVCQTMWSAKNLASISYLGVDALKNPICMNQQNQLDTACSCRSQKGANGGNNCMTASAFTMDGVNVGSLNSLNHGMGTANALVNGSTAPADVNTAANLNGAMRLRNATDKLLTASNLSADKKDIDAASKDLGKFITANQGSLSSTGDNRSTPSSLAGFNPQEALKELAKDIEESNDIGGTTAPSVDTSSGSQDPSIDFGLTEEAAAIQEEQVAEVLNKEMDLGNNDISGSSTNLFETLSHRYQKSGMRRLFDTEGKTQAEPPADTDINK